MVQNMCKENAQVPLEAEKGGGEVLTDCLLAWF